LGTTVSILVALVTGAVLMEGYSWLDAVAVWLMNRAVRHIVRDERERYREEWAADIGAIPTSLYKLAYAVMNFRKGVAYEINAIFLAGALDEIEEFASDTAKDFSRMSHRFERIRARFNKRTWPDELQNDFVALERRHSAFGFSMDKIRELKSRLETRATQVVSVASADGWLDEAERGLDEILALFDDCEKDAK
jgi:hypothetical protein